MSNVKTIKELGYSIEKIAEYFEYLDKLRATGISGDRTMVIHFVNRFPELKKSWGCQSGIGAPRAWAVMEAWIETFNYNESPINRVRKVFMKNG